MTLTPEPTGRSPFLAIVVSVLVCQVVHAQGEEETLLRAAAARSPAVATVLDGPLETPADRLEAVFTLLDLGEIEVAAALLSPVLQAELDDQGRAELVERFGTARFVNLARRDSPADEGETAPLAGARKFARRCIQAASKQARDPQRLAQLVAQLNDPSAEARSEARVDLAVTGTAGAQACLEALARETDETRRANLMLALTKLRPEVDPLLLAVLADGEGRLVRDAAELAGHVGMLDAAPLLAAIAVANAQDAEHGAEIAAAAQTALTKLGLSRADLTDARELLLSEIRRLEASVPADHQPEEPSDSWWTFSSDDGQFLSQQLSDKAQRMFTIARLARTLAALPRSTQQDRQTALLYAYQLKRKFAQPMSPELVQLAQSVEVGDLSLMLGEAIRHGQIAAATACAELLGERGKSAALTSFDSRPAPLARALSHPDLRLRFAALEAVMKLAPKHSFPGASGVPKALWRFAAGAGTPQAVAASSVAARASEWAGQLRALGYDATPAVSGRESLEVAIRSPRLALVLVDSDIGRPRMREILYQLRAAETTARVPIAVLSSLSDLDRAQRLADDDPLLLAVARPHSREAVEEIARQLSELGAAMCSPDERLQQATDALRWIAQLQDAGHPYDEFLRESDVASRTLYVPELQELSLKVLAVLGTAESQRTLIDLASAVSMPLDTRQQAAEAFAKSVERFGKLLTPSEISLQFDRYNSSETETRDTQKVLGQLLDILEGKKPLSP